MFLAVPLEYGIEKDPMFDLIKAEEVKTLITILDENHTWLRDIKI